ncbi:MAG TPA: KpsF/GutQ family sugar-phosphate isomerase [Gemmatimonadaceae bacterium]|nr:KpsF/GutQ family sugar-phosphate isomerase [Gemmatimonadaceae bacterium]
MNDRDLLERGHRVLRTEAEALAETERRLGDSFVAAVRLLAACTGRVIVTGVGKSGLIGHKIAATLTSTGTAATFLHPVESVHGDLGMVGADDVAILLSKSGETEELLALLEHLERFGVRSIAITGNESSTIARLADVSLDGWVREEACPHDLAPTTSTTVALALGDALAVALLEAKGFRREDFARLHPGGSLGRRLLTRVADVMVAEPLPVLPPSAPMKQVVRALASHRGIVMITSDDRLEGVFTAGDFTRLTEQDPTFLDVSVTDVMTRDPKVAEREELASAVVYRMERHGIMAMPVLDSNGSICGVVHLHDLMRAGVA